MNSAMSKVVVHAGLVSDRSSAVDFNICEGREEYSSIRPLEKKFETKSIRVIPMTLDDLVERYHLKPSFIKIDVEGWEPMVLSGSKVVISKYMPIILMEYSSGVYVPETKMTTIEWLKENGYKVYDHLSRVVQVGNEFDGDIIAIPKWARR